MKKIYCNKCKRYLKEHKKWKCPQCNEKVQEMIIRDPSKNKFRYLFYALITFLVLMGTASVVYGVYNVWIK